MLEKIKTIEDLPIVLPVFPLPGLVLFPRCQLPLHIFEARYRAMIGSVLKSHRMIGIVQPVESVGAHRPDLFTVGTVGQVVSYRETGDGRYYVLVEGLCRFRVLEELPLANEGFREVRPGYQNYAKDLQDESIELTERALLLDSLEKYCRVKQMGLGNTSLDELSDEDLLIVTCTGLPFSSGDKQALLEARDGSERISILLALLQMEIHDEPFGLGLPQ